MDHMGMDHSMDMGHGDMGRADRCSMNVSASSILAISPF
jgi:hypothetical protein